MTKRHFGVSGDVRALDTERILLVLATHRVDYVLVGGLAALAHGSTIATADADILPRLDPQNLERALDAIEELGGAIFVSERRQAMEAGEPWEVTDVNDRGGEALASAEAWHFTTNAGPIDLVVRVTGVGSYDAHVASAQDRNVFGVVIKVAGLGDLIASKEAMRRTKDEAILRELRDIREEGGT